MRGGTQIVVERLEGADGNLVADEGFYSLNGGSGALDGSDAGDGAGHRGGADLVAVDPGAGVAVGSVDNHIDLAGVDQIYDIVRAFEVLADHGHGDPVAV